MKIECCNMLQSTLYNKKFVEKTLYNNKFVEQTFMRIPKSRALCERLDVGLKDQERMKFMHLHNATNWFLSSTSGANIVVFLCVLLCIYSSQYVKPIIDFYVHLWVWSCACIISFKRSLIPTAGHWNKNRTVIFEWTLP